ncbi:MAG: polymer-forming cytoskeletal protein [Candidatus Uhrbacteria bacterium]|nr:polymer-forming cytoskeletal protein [Candidatus Uhrbacteria bacterium]
MFNSKHGSSYDGKASDEGATTVIARGVKVEGEFTSQSDVLIEGEVHGTFSTAGMLTVGSEAKIKADVKAGSAMVSGTIEGNVIVTKHLDVKATAKIMGDVTTETVMIESGAILSGRMTVGVKPSGAAATVAAESPRGRINGRERVPVLASES